jgi:hypothetical protein
VPGKPGNVEPGGCEPGNVSQGHSSPGPFGTPTVRGGEAPRATPATRAVNARMTQTAAEFLAVLLLIPPR